MDVSRSATIDVFSTDNRSVAYKSPLYEEAELAVSILTDDGLRATIHENTKESDPNKGVRELCIKGDRAYGLATYAVLSLFHFGTVPDFKLRTAKDFTYSG